MPWWRLQKFLFSIFDADEIAWDIHPEQIDPSQVAEALAEIHQRTRFSSLVVTQTPDLSRDEIATWYRQPERFVKYASTRCAWTRLKVWPNGDVKPCRGWVVGNVAQTPAMEVWNGEQFRSFRRLLAERGALPICRRAAATWRIVKFWQFSSPHFRHIQPGCQGFVGENGGTDAVVTQCAAP